MHLIGRVQPHGAILAFDAQWIATHASENIATYLDRGPDQLIGQPISALLDEDLVHDLRSRLQTIAGSDLSVAKRAVPLPGGLSDLALSATGKTTLIEFEAHSAAAQDGEVSLIAPLLHRIPDDGPPDRLHAAIARAFKVLTGFDRVMVYRFAPDGTGEVVGETHASGMEPYLGLRYPKTDIPQQARALLLRNPVRLIADVTDEGVPVIGRGDLDLSLSGIRAVSPIHLEYLRNMGVACTMTVSLIVDGALWGLISCHHRRPRPVPATLRGAAALLGQMVAQKIGLALGRADLALGRRSADMAAAVLDMHGADHADLMDSLTGHLADMLPSDALLLLDDDQLFVRGIEDPDRAVLNGLARDLIAAANGAEIWHSDHLAADLPGRPLHGMAGALVLPLSGDTALIVLRRALPQVVRWAGAPGKPATDGGRLTPRASFAAWEEQLKDRAAPWSAQHLHVAGILRNALTEMSLRRSFARGASLQRAHDSQEIVISELNHRVRNIFALIRGIVQQSRADDPDALRATVLSRLDALATAHMYLTRTDRAALSELLTAEARAFAAEGQQRLRLEGPDHWIEPTAAPTVALVLHELLTNAVKYGALSQAGGSVLLTAAPQPDGGLCLTWQEQDGPRLQDTGRRGFGSTIIEGTIPYELGGTARMELAPDGLRARFTIPAAHVAIRASNTNVPAQTENTTDALRGIRRLMLVEDNMLIAMDVADGLRSLGVADVILARSVAEGQELTRDGLPDLAILDIGLGAETSRDLALWLAARDCPLILASGHSASTLARDGFPDAPLLQKPYDMDAVTRLAAKVLDRKTRSA